MAVGFCSVSMAHCKNVRGGSGGDERHLPRLTAKEMDKGPKKVMTKKKCKRGDIAAERVAVVEHAERGGRGSGIHIGD